MIKPLAEIVQQQHASSTVQIMPSFDLHNVCLSDTSLSGKWWWTALGCMSLQTVLCHVLAMIVVNCPNHEKVTEGQNLLRKEAGP